MLAALFGCNVNECRDIHAMKARFIGGAYDGLELDHNQINDYCDIITCPADSGGVRQFLQLPSLEKWDDLVEGTISIDNKDEWGPIWMYERKGTPASIEYHVVTEPL